MRRLVTEESVAYILLEAACCDSRCVAHDPKMNLSIFWRVAQRLSVFFSSREPKSVQPEVTGRLWIGSWYFIISFIILFLLHWLVVKSPPSQTRQAFATRRPDILVFLNKLQWKTRKELGEQTESEYDHGWVLFEVSDSLRFYLDSADLWPLSKMARKSVKRFMT